MIDTSVLVAGLIDEHEFHRLARPQLANSQSVSAVVLAEAYACLRRAFRLGAPVVASVLAPWSQDSARVAVLSPEGVVELFALAPELSLGSNIHDAVIAKTAAEAGEPLVTLDRRQHAIALALGVDSTYLGG